MSLRCFLTSNYAKKMKGQYVYQILGNVNTAVCSIGEKSLVV